MYDSLLRALSTSCCSMVASFLAVSMTILEVFLETLLETARASLSLYANQKLKGKLCIMQSAMQFASTDKLAAPLLLCNVRGNLNIIWV